MLHAGTGSKCCTAQHFGLAEPGYGVGHPRVGAEAGPRLEGVCRPFVHITPAKALACGTDGGALPFHLAGQTPAGPAAPGIGLPPAHMHGRLGAHHAQTLAKAGLQHRAAGHADLLHKARSAAAFPLNQGL